jgi:uncharacterized protein YggE
MNMKFRLVGALSATAMILLLGVSALAQQKTIDVTGHGDSSAKPDMMTLSFTVTAHADSADECTRKQAETSRQVIDALKAKLGDSAKVTTSDFSFNPSMEYGSATATPVGMTASEPTPTPATWRFNGEVYTLTETIDPIPDLLETGIAAGAKSMGESPVQETGVDWDPKDWGATASGFTSQSSAASGTGAPPRMVPMFRLALSVETTGVSAVDAMRKGIALMNRVGIALRAKMSGHGRVDVGPFGVNQLNPPEETQVSRYQPPPPPQPQRKVYDAQVTISAETPKLELLGPSVEVAMKAGAVRLNQVTFSLKDDSAARKEAIEKASEDAKSKAETLASSMGVKLKEILRLSTSAQMRPYIVYGNQYMSAMRGASALTAAPVQAEMPVTPRDVGFSADVNVTYQIE